MTDEIKESDSIKVERVRSRRELLAGAAGALGPVAVASIVKATPASANTGDSFQLGNSNFADLTTSLESNSPSNFYFTLLSAAHTGSGFAIDGSSQGIAVHAQSSSAMGVWAEGKSYGVYGTGDRGLAGIATASEGVYGQHGPVAGTVNQSGVHGVTDSSTDPAILGESKGGAIGVAGSSSGAGAGVSGTSTSGHGVHGVSNDLNANGVGVLGEQKGSNFGTGVVGVGAIGIQGNSNVAGHTGVIGVGTTGVYGQALTGGMGVLAEAAFDGTGVALLAGGTAQFNGTIQAARSGVASIRYPNTSAVVAVSGGLTKSSLVLATLQNAISGVFVVSAVPNPSTGKVTITLNQAPGSATTPRTAKVVWFVVN